MMTDVKLMISAIAGAIGIVSTTFSGVLWFKSTVRKRYAAERDFNHLKRNYEQLSQNVAHMKDLQDEKLDRIFFELVLMRETLGLQKRSSEI